MGQIKTWAASSDSNAGAWKGVKEGLEEDRKEGTIK